MTLPRLSFEFFPPQTLDASFHLWETVQMLAPLNPDFVSVTYGAGGATRALTHDAVCAISHHYGLNVAAHLTCVQAGRDETMAIAGAYAACGITQIVALRGDPPKGEAGFVPVEGGFAGSIDLIAALAQTGRFKIHAAAYPELHLEAGNMDEAMDWLKRKIDAGAQSLITQFFFEAETFLRFRDICVAHGITVPITPGILPIDQFAKAKNFALRCGMKVPFWLEDAYRQAARDGREELLSVALCSELCDDLLGEGVEDLHFYTLNRPQLTYDTCIALGAAPVQKMCHKVHQVA